MRPTAGGAAPRGIGLRRNLSINLSFFSSASHCTFFLLSGWQQLLAALTSCNPYSLPTKRKGTLPAVGRKTPESITMAGGVVGMRIECFDWSSLSHVPMLGPITEAQGNGVL